MNRILACCLILSLGASAQGNPYPQNYFRNPVAIPILFAGNFGESRPGHFHSGIDIKTEGRENLPVFAAAEGYISRIKLEPGGFGHAIYITHPNGYTTLYAHLNDFFPALQKLVHAEQYARQSWTLDLRFTPDQFPVSKGQWIAQSGNTGGSTAPHLHFEIRNTQTEHPLNPQLFGFAIQDNIAPKPSAIAIYDAQKSVYEQKPLQFKLQAKEGQYAPEDSIVVCSSKQINLALAVNDFMNISDNTLSIYTAEWYLNDSLQGKLTLDDIGYDETRYLNACADYKLHHELGTWYNYLFVLPNNQLTRLYTQLKNERGYIQLAEHNKIRIVLQDNSGNTSTVRFDLQYKESNSIANCSNLWQAAKQNQIATPNVKIQLSPNCLYDAICFEFQKTYQNNALSSRYQLHQANVPLHQYVDLSIKPERMLPFALNRKIVLVYHDGTKQSAKAAQLSNAWYTASVRNFGAYWLAVDTTAPMIKPMQKQGIAVLPGKMLRFKISDNYTSVKKCTATINGQWLCLEQHEEDWFYVIDEHCPKGKNKLELLAVDENGNERKMSFLFTY